ncbi:MAG TPA: nucleotidyltransferase family protein [Spirochaetota bacterium]|nr:nucleotidyltransferase family protein [Spirochaetota bacterium]
MNRQDILQKLRENREVFERYGIKKIGLFGSYARNEATEDSDIDLIYENDSEKSMSYIDFVELDEYLTKSFNKKVELVNYKYMNPIIKKNSEKDFIYA